MGFPSSTAIGTGGEWVTSASWERTQFKFNFKYLTVYLHRSRKKGLNVKVKSDLLTHLLKLN